MRQCYLGARALSYCYGRDMKASEKFKLVRFLLLKCHPSKIVLAQSAELVESVYLQVCKVKSRARII